MSHLHELTRLLVGTEDRSGKPLPKPPEQNLIGARVVLTKDCKYRGRTGVITGISQQMFYEVKFDGSGSSLGWYPQSLAFE